MKLQVVLTRVLVTALVLGAPSIARAKIERAVRRPDVLKTLKVGQWLRIEGEVRNDRTVSCTEIKLLAGDFQDDDWEMFGQVEVVDRRNGEFRIAMVTIRPSENADFESPDGSIKALADLRPGMLVEVGGTYTKDGFLATDVDDESGGRRAFPRQRRIGITARIERVDVARRGITAMGMVFVVTENTQIKSVIR